MKDKKKCPCGNMFGGTPNSKDCCDSGKCVIDNLSPCCGLTLSIGVKPT